MTTPDQHTPHTQATGPTQEFRTGTAPIDSPSGQEPSPAATPMESDGQDKALAQSTDLDTDESLFSDLLSGLRSRWDDVQASFVDDPKQCVQKADSLVSDVIDRLTDGFAQARSRLEEQWARGEEASTEDLRQALKRYREFFHRLLSVEDTEAEHRARSRP